MKAALEALYDAAACRYAEDQEADARMVAQWWQEEGSSRSSQQGA